MTPHAKRTPEPADIDHDGRAPRDRRTGDIYFNADGLAETRHVFLEGCGLPAAWENNRAFVIGETGFGLGLNFLSAWGLFAGTAKPGAVLHYVAFENRPPSSHSIRSLSARFPEISALAEKLADAWPPPLFGWDRLWFDDQICLTIVIGSAEKQIGELPPNCVDAWFLDGFAPSANPELWSAPVFDGVASASKPGARLATFTAAGDVRRALQERGFDVERRPGFGSKRHCVSAIRAGASVAVENIGAVSITGSGVAGACLADALRKRGVAITMDRSGPSHAASDAPFALMTPRLDVGEGLASVLYPSAYRYALRFWRGIEGWDPRSTQRLATNAALAAKHDKLLAIEALPRDQMRRLDPQEMGAVLGCETAFGGLEFAKGGRIEPRRALTDLAKRRSPITQDSLADADVLCVGAGLSGCAPELQPYLSLRRGQMSAIANDSIGVVADAAAVFGHWIGPILSDRRWIGASFERWTDDEPGGVSAEIDTQNIAAIDAALTGWRSRAPKIVDAFAGLRATTADRHPVLGRLTDGRWVLGGLGARGFSTAPLLGEALADLICGTPPPLPRRSLAQLAPGRFAERALKRSQSGQKRAR